MLTRGLRIGTRGSKLALAQATLVRDTLFGQTVDKVRHGLNIPMLVARPDPNPGRGDEG